MQMHLIPQVRVKLASYYNVRPTQNASEKTIPVDVGLIDGRALNLWRDNCGYANWHNEHYETS